MIKNLVYKGGGVLGMAYAGAITELESRGIMKGIERVAGTSAGSIVACLVALKYTAAEIEKIVNDTDFNSFADGSIVQYLEICDKYGAHPGDNFLKWIQDKIEKRGLNKNCNFRELVAAGFLDLHVFATDLNTRSLKRFSYQETPNVNVSEAIRASMSIPLFFHAFQFTSSIPDNHIYVDGGCVYNYPLTVFDVNGQDNEETLGLFLADIHNKNMDNGLRFGHLIDYIKALAPAILDSQNIDLSQDASDMKRTCIIDSLGISATNFGIRQDQKDALFVKGKEGVATYFSPPPLG